MVGALRQPHSSHVAPRTTHSPPQPRALYESTAQQQQNLLQGVLQQSVILWKPRMPTKTIDGVKNVICTCSLGTDIYFFTFRMNFELRD